MNANRKKQVGLFLLVIVIAGLLAVVSGAQADPLVTPLAPDGTWYGKTYDELAIEWWQWVGTVKVKGLPHHPLVADGEMDCSPGQKGEVWFLGGTFGPRSTGTADRECDIPVGKALFFPIVNIICSPLTHDPDDPEFLLACAINPGDVYGFELEMHPVSASIDGEDIENLDNYYVEPGVTFDIGPLPKPNVFSAKKNAIEPAATTGYYLLLPPLSEGTHTLEFKGEFTGDYPSFFDITYTLHVK